MRSLCWQAKQAVADELEQFPARLTMADGVKHVGWLSDRYDSLERDFPNLSWHAVMVTLYLTLFHDRF